MGLHRARQEGRYLGEREDPVAWGRFTERSLDTPSWEQFTETSALQAKLEKLVIGHVEHGVPEFELQARPEFGSQGAAHTSLFEFDQQQPRAERRALQNSRPNRRGRYA